MSDLNSRARDLFLRLLNHPINELPEALDATCGQENALRQRVQELLDAHHQAGNFLATSQMDETCIADSPAVSGIDSSETSSVVTAQPGAMIGPYKLLKPIGEGGMGTVWVATQSKPIKRKVAIKLIKAGMDSCQVLTRFDAERQALAMMDHPNIARVLDGGVTEQGRPYFAMEYVKGVPLTEYCDGAKLSLNRRLELFLPICKAVQHAHQKGIIHRDLKPSNILICQYDGKPVPKVIDFGLAKAMHHSLTDQSLDTANGMMVGTPLYMSPEQAEHNNLDIDTRTDVYALGVILYELLTGSTPLEKAQMRQAAFNEVLRLIKEVDPPKPSTRLTGSESLPSVAAQRSIEPAHLTRCIIGDLDWVVMKALEKERTRRYETASGLAEDIRRHLSNEPVSACPPSRRYRMKKFIRRNRVGVIAVVAVAVVLLLGVAGTTAGMLWALSERQVAINARQAESAARLRAVENAAMTRMEADRATAAEQKTAITLKEVAAERDAKQRALREAKQISEFLTGLFQSPDPERDGRQVKVVDLLDAAALKLKNELVEQPEQRANLQLTLSDTYHALGLQNLAIPLAEQAHDYFLTNFGSQDSRTLKAMCSLAVYYNHLGRRAEALTLSEECYTVSRETLGPDHPQTLKAMSHLAFIHFLMGRHDAALRLRAEAVTLLTDTLGPTHPDTLAAKNSLASSYFHSGKRDEGLKQREELLATCREELGMQHLTTHHVMNNLASAYSLTNQRLKALELREEQLSICIEEFGPTHIRTLRAMSSVAYSYHRTGRKEDALILREQLLTLCRQELGAEHWLTMSTMSQLATEYNTVERRQQTIELREEHLMLQLSRVHSEQPPTDHVVSSLAYSALPIASLQVWEQRLREYDSLVQRLFNLCSTPENPEGLERVAKIACLASHADRDTYDFALTLAKKALELGKDDAGFQPWIRMTVGMAEYRSGDFEAAERILSGEESKAGVIGGTTAYFRAMALFQQGKEQAAEELFEAAKVKMKPPPDSERIPIDENGFDQVITWLAYKEANALIK